MNRCATMENENDMAPEGAPVCGACPEPSFAVGQEWYSRIREATTHECGLALKLMAFCAERGNGGFIADCRGWSVAKWQKNVGICRPDQKKNSFFSWVGNGLHLHCRYAAAPVQALRACAATAPAAFHAPAGNSLLQAPAAEEREKEKQKEREKGVVLKGRLPNCLPYPQDAHTVAELMQLRAGCQLPPDMMLRCAMDFLDTFAARGWVDARGQRVTDWRPCACKFARSWEENQRRPRLPRPGSRTVNTRNENANKNHVQDYEHP